MDEFCDGVIEELLADFIKLSATIVVIFSV